MYDVKKFIFDKEDCWFKINCNLYNTKKCNCGCPAYCQYYYLVNLANIPKRMQYPENQVLFAQNDIDKYKYLAQIKDDMVNWVNNGNNLFLYSQHCGNGKTTWAIKLMSKYFSDILFGNGIKCRGLFINVDDFLLQKKRQIQQFDQRFKEMELLLTEVDLVIWDDIGCTKLSDFDHTTLFPLINSRIINGKANIFTSNLIDDEFVNNVGTRLASRVLETSTIVEFTNSPQRTPARGDII